MGDKTITISCPLSDDRVWIIDHYLKHIYDITYDKRMINLYFVLNSNFKIMEKILKQFKNEHEHEYKSIKIDYYYKNASAPQDRRENNVRLQHTYNFLSDMRNKILDYASKMNSMLFSCDSDILVPKDILHRLLNSNKDIISSLIYNGYLMSPQSPHNYPNILNYTPDGKLVHISNWYVKNAPNLSEPKLLEVDCTGACYLLSNEVVSDKRLRFGFDFQGEDIFYCREVKKNGYEIWCDLSVYSSHIMNQELLKNILTEEDKVNRIHK